MMQNSHKKVCLLGASFATDNMGVGAITAGAIQCILHRLPEAEIVLLDYGKKEITYDFPFRGKIVPIQMINMRFSKRVYLKNNIAFLILIAFILKLIPFQNVKTGIIIRNICLQHLHEADIIAAIAAGDSFSDIYGLGRLFYVALPQLLVLFMGRELFLLPQTLGPFRGRIARFIAKYIIGHARMAYSRDFIGQKWIGEFLGSRLLAEKVRFCYDVGFVLEPIPPEKIDVGDLLAKKKENCCVVGMNISGLLFMGGYTRKNMFGLKIEYRELVYDILDLLMRKPEVVVLLVPHVFGPPENSESDAVVCERIYNDQVMAPYKSRLFLVKGEHNQNTIKYVIGLCDFFIGSRMHACIAALSQCIPAVAIAYSNKFLGVMQTIAVDSLVADPREMGKKEILGIISSVFERRHFLRRQLELGIPHVKQKALNLFDEIIALAWEKPPRR